MCSSVSTLLSWHIITIIVHALVIIKSNFYVTWLSFLKIFMLLILFLYNMQLLWYLKQFYFSQPYLVTLTIYLLVSRAILIIQGFILFFWMLRVMRVICYVITQSTFSARWIDPWLLFFQFYFIFYILLLVDLLQILTDDDM